MFSFNDALRHAERRRVFDVDGLRQLAAQSVDRSLDDIVDFAKLADSGFNRTFLLTMRDSFQMVAHIPYRRTRPRLPSTTLSLVYGYSPAPDNAAETEYILMEFIQGTKLSDVWFDLDDVDFFPGWWKPVYYTQDLEKVAGGPGILLEDDRFCVGADTRLPSWFGRRSQLDIDRGPYKSAEAVLIWAAHKELAYLKRFGQPLLPFQRMRREGYRYQEQSPSDHIKNLDRYLLIAPPLIPRDPGLGQFRIRHLDLQESNIFVSRSPDSNWKVGCLFDWQHASILPSFILAGVPDRIQNYGDPISELMTRPSLPENLNALNEIEQSRETELLRLVHYHYVKNTEEYNELHYEALTDPASVLRRRLFHHASDPWEGETSALKVALVDATEDWETLAGGGVPCPVLLLYRRRLVHYHYVKNMEEYNELRYEALTGPAGVLRRRPFYHANSTDDWETLTGGGGPCPLAVDAADIRETVKLDEVQRRADGTLGAWRDLIGFGLEGWVPFRGYEEAMALSKQMKDSALAASAVERSELYAEAYAEIVMHWPLDDMDEEKYT
ncbi:hypothetical protein B0H12DRAFT_1231401 [Mycena haematopus]|nr:hypothetical protein B0H12DRAFT_1231401 [Mycena haematopus]